MRLTIGIIAAYLALSATVAADDLAAARDAIANGDYAAAVVELERAAATDDDTALTLLAALHHRGEGVPKDIQRAIELYTQAAELGNAEAQFNLGNIYLLGEGVRADESWALTYYRQAASQGHELAARNMAELYRAAGLEPPVFEKDTPVDVARAEIEADVPTQPPVAEQPLAPTTRTGYKAEDVDVDVDASDSATVAESDAPQTASEPVKLQPADPPAPSVSSDEIEAIRLAEEHGVEVTIDPNDAAATAQILVDADQLALRDAMTAIAREDFEHGVDGLNTLSEGGYGPAQYEMSRLFLAGHGVAQDTGSAMRWLHSAAAAGHTTAQFDLGNRYLIGAGVEFDDAMAITLLRDAARAGHGVARERLAGIYANAGIPLPELERPSTPIAPAVVPARVALSEPDAETPAASVPAAAPIEPEPVVEIESGEGTLAASVPAEPPLESEPDVVVEPVEEARTATVPAAPPIEPEPPAAVELIESESIVAIEPIEPEPVASVEPEPLAIIERRVAEATAPVREPYEYSVIDHDAEVAPVVDIDEINPAKPADHEVISGGELAQARIVAVTETEIEDLAPLEDEIVAAAPVTDEIPELIEIPSAPPSEAHTVMEDDAKLIVVEEAVAVAATAVPDSSVTVGTPEPPAVSSVPFPAPKEKKQGLFDKLKDVIGGDNKASITSRAPGSTPDPRLVSSTTTNSKPAEEMKLALARAAEPRPIGEKPTLDGAKQAVAAGEYRRAAAMFRVLAEDGDAEAQAHIGYMTYKGEGVTRDRGKAVDWYRRAAVQGNRDAQYNLAVAYAFGEGVPQDDVEAVVWYRRASEQGSAISQYSLGVSYALGEGVEQSDALAAKWYREAAQQGYPPAQYNLAYMHRAGKGIAQDDVEALKWFMEAAKNGHASAQYSLGYMYRSGKGVVRDVDEAIRWYRMAADQGHPEARADLSSLAPDG